MDIFGFGKHKYKHPSEVPVDYLKWCLANVPDLDPSLRSAIQDSLRKRGAGSYAGDPAGSGVTRRAPVAVSMSAALEIVREGRRALALKHHPDRGGDTEKMTCVNASADYLEQQIVNLLPMGRVF